MLFRPTILENAEKLIAALFSTTTTVYDSPESEPLDVDLVFRLIKFVVLKGRREECQC